MGSLAQLMAQAQQMGRTQLPIAPTQVPTPTPTATFLNNSNQIEKIIQTAQAVQNPVAYLQSQIQNSPLIKRALELGKQFNGDYDAATRAVLLQNNIDPDIARTRLNQLGIK